MKIVSFIISFISTNVRQRLTNTQFIVLLAIIVGIFSGFAAVILKTCLHYLETFLSNQEIFSRFYIVLPLVGLLLCTLVVQRFFKGKIDRGIGGVLRAINKRAAFIPFYNNYLHIITSLLTLGFGGSAGVEAPIVATGSSLGSNVARRYNLGYRERMLLLACGAAAGISAIFNAPVAGAIFAFEILLTETISSYFIPLMIASVAGSLCFKVIMHDDAAIFNFTLNESFTMSHVPFYILLGVACGFISLYYVNTYTWVEHRFSLVKNNPYRRALVGGLVLMALCFLFPPLFGEGFQSIKTLAGPNPYSLIEPTILPSTINPWLFALFVFLIMAVKSFAVSATLSGGGNGGSFAPSMFVGAYLGFFVAKSCNLLEISSLPEVSFLLVGMAGMLSGIMHAPLTAIFLIAEITNGYGLFIPLMIVSSFSFFIVKHYRKGSMEIMKLASSGDIYVDNKDQNILSHINLQNVIKRNVPELSPDDTLEKLVEIVKKNSESVFAVTGEDRQLLGLVRIDEIKHLLFDRKEAGLPVSEFMKKADDVIYLTDNTVAAMRKLDKSGHWQLPVVAGNTYVGFISKSALFSLYRQTMVMHSDFDYQATTVKN